MRPGLLIAMILFVIFVMFTSGCGEESDTAIYPPNELCPVTGRILDIYPRYVEIRPGEQVQFHALVETECGARWLPMPPEGGAI